MYNLFLDDIRDPKISSFSQNEEIYRSLNWIIVRNYDDFCSHISNNGLPFLISFDHDIGEKTGYDCAKWLIDYCIKNDLNPPHYLIHSMNPVGSENIKYIIENYKKFLRL